MLLDLNDDQRLLRESLDRFLADNCDFESRRRHQREPEGFSRKVWAGLAELGLLGLLVPAEDDGFGGTAVDAMVAMEAIGRALLPEPFLPTVLLGGVSVTLAGNAEQRARILPAMVAGDSLIGFAHAEPQARYDLADVATTARRDGDGWVLDGEKSLVLAGGSADWLVVSARGPDGIALFLLPAATPGIERIDYPTHDGLRAADLRLRNVRVGDDALLSADALPVIERVIDGAMAALVAELVGIMTALQALTLEHLKTRVQFDKVIGTNQVLQHRVVDMVMAIEQARSMAILAAIRLDDPDPVVRRSAVAAAKAVAGRAATAVARDAVQLHGGMGITLEHPVGHYFKRVAAIEALFGNADHHIAALARDGGPANAVA